MNRVSSSEFSRDKNKAAHRATFEQTYPRYEFAELVRLALAAGTWLVQRQRRVARQRSGVTTKPLPVDMKPAE